MPEARDGKEKKTLKNVAMPSLANKQGENWKMLKQCAIFMVCSCEWERCLPNWNFNL